LTEAQELLSVLNGKGHKFLIFTMRQEPASHILLYSIKSLRFNAYFSGETS